MKLLAPIIMFSCCCTMHVLKPVCCSTCPCNKKARDTKELVRQAYGKVAQTGDCCACVGGCCGGGKDLSKYIGYSEEELKSIPEAANLGLGCGNPVMLGEIKKGATVLDLGSGAGIDCFLAARKVGPTGNVIGVDMTPDMIKKARENASKHHFTNVEFRLGDIEQLPVKSDSVDIIISNCVINLAPHKDRVFKEAYRVLKKGGSMYVSDVVLLAPLTRAQHDDVKLLCACVSGALPKNECIKRLQETGFSVKVVGLDTSINKKWFNDSKLPIASLKFIATK